MYVSNLLISLGSTGSTLSRTNKLPLALDTGSTHKVVARLAHVATVIVPVNTVLEGADSLHQFVVSLAGSAKVLFVLDATFNGAGCSF
jgi:hypothetical protein